ncbi:MAG: glycoside hydrolase family 99-like domain-containing protein [Pirellulaceae bacterium]|nr:glycoside hydrolase family 99-like domain-containing protein [Pirellulaceae bacterium]
MEVFVNGKSTKPAEVISAPAQAFRAVRFAQSGPGALWVDDVHVYPWQEYPTDYVPSPQPAPRRGDYLLGVQSCSLWKEGDAYAGWDYVYPFADRRTPMLGWYDEGNPEVADWEIKWQVEHGIDFEQYCWYRPNDAIDHPIKDGVLEQGIRDGLFNARYSHLKKFTIMYTNQGAGATNADDWRRHMIPYWIEYFFQDPRYLKVDGKPILAIYDPGNFVRDFGGERGARQAIEQLRGDCADAGFPGIIVLMELRNARQDMLQTLKTIGVDYCYAYTWGTGDVNHQRQQNIAQRDAAAAVGFRMLPSISVGWQTSPWDGTQDPGNGWASVADYRALAQWAKDEFMPTLPPDSLGRRVLMLANWNEFGEGHFLMPSSLAGFGYLDALRETFTSGGPHADPVPDLPQKRRFTALFPRD